jgi:integrase
MSKLTAKQVENIKPHVTLRREIPAGNNLYLVVQPRPSGAKSWCVRYRHARRSKKLTLGSVFCARKGEPVPKGALTLAAAREAAAIALRKLEHGVDPAATKPKLPPAPETFEAVARQCLEREAARLRSAPLQLRNLERLAFRTLGSRPINEIKRGDVVRLCDRIEDENGVTAADAILATIGKVMRWHARRDDDYACPLVTGMRRAKSKERQRTRVLDDRELAAVWKAADATEGPFGVLVMFLLLTGARRNEASHMSRDGEIIDDIWTLPPERSKTKTAVTRPLSRKAQELLARLPVIAPGTFYFTLNGKAPLKALTPHKRRLDDASGVRGWTLHDCRRTARSLMARAGVLNEVAERALGHAMPGVLGVYNKHQYESELRLAYEKLATLIQNIVRPDERIVPLRA